MTDIQNHDYTNCLDRDNYCLYGCCSSNMYESEDIYNNYDSIKLKNLDYLKKIRKFNNINLINLIKLQKLEIKKILKEIKKKIKELKMQKTLKEYEFQKILKEKEAKKNINNTEYINIKYFDEYIKNKNLEVNFEEFLINELQEKKNKEFKLFFKYNDLFSNNKDNKDNKINNAYYVTVNIKLDNIEFN